MSRARSTSRRCGPVAPTSGCSWVSGDTQTTDNAASVVLSSEDPNGNMTTYQYANAQFDDHPTSVTTGSTADNSQETTSYTYDADGRQVLVTRPSGDLVATGYDVASRPCWTAPSNATGTCATPPSGTGVSTFTYDAAGERTQTLDNAGTASPLTNTYTYTNGQLTKRRRRERHDGRLSLRL